MEMNNLRITMHGGAMEVGRSCIEVEWGNRRFLLDAGLKFIEGRSEAPLFPTPIKNIIGIDCIFLSHAHLDHCGALPHLNHQGLSCPIYCTPLTKALAKVMLEDSFKVETIEDHEPVYTKTNIRRVLRLMQPVDYGVESSHEGLNFKFIDAGHIPGSCAIELDFGGKKIVYTGDINTEETELLNGSNIASKISGCDVAITESTYGERDHPERSLVKAAFLDAVEATIRGGGSALVPVFALGRSQEILLTLTKLPKEIPIFFDGMGMKLTRLMLDHPQFLKNHEMLRSIFNRVHLVKGKKDREFITKERGVFVTTSGMMDGGPVLDYVEHLWFDQKNSILLTGYQAPGTNGRMLLESGKVIIKKPEGEEFSCQPRCRIEKFDFSAHAGAKELQGMLSAISPKALVVQHGDEDSVKGLGGYFDKKTRVHLPGIDEPLDIEM